MTVGEQLAIDFTMRARKSDPQTSHDAAGRAGEFAGQHHAIILGDLMTRGPGTIHELAERTGLDHVAVARRMSELETLRTVETTGETRPGPSGRHCREWRAR
jgi:predicted ArsR family transcriptional regulator